MIKKPKIAILIDLLIPGGVQKTAIAEVINLKKLGFDATLLILMHKWFDQKNSYMLEGIPFEFLPDRFPKYLQINFKIPYFKFLSLSHLLYPLIAPLFIKKNDFDLIISHSTTASATALSLLYFKKIPYFTLVYDPMLYIFEKVYNQSPLKYLTPIAKIVILAIEKKIITSATVCFVISRVHAQFIKTRYKISPAICHLGVKPPQRISTSHGDKILALGRWEKEKNIEKILDLAQSLPKAHFIVAGSWTHQNDLNWFKSQITKRRIEKQLALITNYREDELPNICKKASFWIHPHFEAFSLSALEAASYGLPIIIPAGSGVTELFKNGQHGFFPPVGDKKAFFQSVKFLHGNPQKARQMGQEAAKIARKYTWQKHSKVLASYIKKTLRE